MIESLKYFKEINVNIYVWSNGSTYNLYTLLIVVTHWREQPTSNTGSFNSRERTPLVPFA